MKFPTRTPPEHWMSLGRPDGCDAFEFEGVSEPHFSALAVWWIDSSDIAHHIGYIEGIGTGWRPITLDRHRIYLDTTPVAACEKLLHLGVHPTETEVGDEPIERYVKLLDWTGQPTEQVRYVGNRPIRDVLRRVNEHLANWWMIHAAGWDVEPYGQDHGTEGLGSFPGLSDKDPWPEGRRVLVFPVRGANEGHYVHVEIEFGDGRDNTLIALDKTFLGADHAWAVAREISRALEID